MSQNVLVFVEHKDEKIKKTSFELLSEGLKVSKALGSPLIAAVLGDNTDGLSSQLKEYGVSEVFTASNAALKTYSPEIYAHLLAQIVKGNNVQVVLATASSLGRDLMPRLAAKLGAGMASEATHIEVKDGKLTAKRPIYSGKVVVDVSFQSPLAIITCRPNVFETVKVSPNEPKVTPVTLDNLPAAKAKIREVQATKSDKVDLVEAETIVAAGRSIKSAENFSMIQDLANVLNGAIGASRAAVDAGFASHSIQVGQTGKTVNPKLYIACGISGAIQHLAGMRTSKVIVAINSDPEAPIFQNCDYGIVGDMFQIVPLFTQEFKKLLSE